MGRGRRQSFRRCIWEMLECKHTDDCTISVKRRGPGVIRRGGSISRAWQSKAQTEFFQLTCERKKGRTTSDPVSLLLSKSILWTGAATYSCHGSHQPSENTKIAQPPFTWLLTNSHEKKNLVIFFSFFFIFSLSIVDVRLRLEILLHGSCVIVKHLSCELIYSSAPTLPSLRAVTWLMRIATGLQKKKKRKKNCLWSSENTFLSALVHWFLYIYIYI